MYVFLLNTSSYIHFLIYKFQTLKKLLKHLTVPLSDLWLNTYLQFGTHIPFMTGIIF